MDTVQNNKHRTQKSMFTFFVITSHLMMKHEGILSNEKQLRFCCSVLNNPRGEFCLLFAIPVNVTQQRSAPGQQDNNTCDLMQCKHRAERDAMGDERNGLRGRTERKG